MLFIVLLGPIAVFFRAVFRFFLCVLLFWGPGLPADAQSVLPFRLPLDPLLEDVLTPSDLTLKGVRSNPLQPFKMDFIFDRNMNADHVADIGNSPDALRQIRYFLSALVIPAGDIWINLSPYEKDRVAAPDLARTAMGQDLMVSDYLLKQVTAELLHPDNIQGKEFWSGVYASLYKEFGTTDIPLDAFNKVWITSDSAAVFESSSCESSVPGAAAVVTRAHLKVLLEADYRAASVMPQSLESSDNPARQTARQAMRQVIIPALEREVNESPRFARIREVYRALVLAVWYKNKLRDSFIAQVYVDSRKTRGMEDLLNIPAESVWNAYMDNLKQGVFDLIREETDPWGAEIVPRRYMSGGVMLAGDAAQDAYLPEDLGSYVRISASLQVQTDAAQGLDLNDKNSYTVKMFEEDSKEFLPRNKKILRKYEDQLKSIKTAINKNRISDFSVRMVELLKDLENEGQRRKLVTYMRRLFLQADTRDWLGWERMKKVLEQEGFSSAAQDLEQSFVTLNQSGFVGPRMINLLVEASRLRNRNVITEARNALLLMRLFSPLGFDPRELPAMKDFIFLEDLGRNEWLSVDPFVRGGIVEEVQKRVDSSNWLSLMEALAQIRTRYIHKLEDQRAFIGTERMVADLLFETGYYTIDIFLQSYAREEVLKKQIKPSPTTSAVPLQEKLMKEMIAKYEVFMTLGSNEDLRARLYKVVRSYKNDLLFSDISTSSVSRKILQEDFQRKFFVWLKPWVTRFLREWSGFSNGGFLEEKLAFIVEASDILLLSSRDIILLKTVIALAREKIRITPKRVLAADEAGRLTSSDVERWRDSGTMGDRFLPYVEIPWVSEEDALVEEEVLMSEKLDSIVSMGLEYEGTYADAVSELASYSGAPRVNVRSFLENPGKGGKGDIYFTALQETRTIVRNGRLARGGYDELLAGISRQLQIEPDVLRHYWNDWGITPQRYFRYERDLSVNGYGVSLLASRWVRNDYLSKEHLGVVTALIDHFLQGGVDSNQNDLPHINRLQNKAKSVSVYVILSGVVSSSALNGMGYDGTGILNRLVDEQRMVKLKDKNQWVFRDNGSVEEFSGYLDSFFARYAQESSDYSLLQSLLVQTYRSRKITVVGVGPIAHFKQSVRSHSMPPEFKQFLQSLNSGEALKKAVPVKTADTGTSSVNPGGIDLNPDNIRLLVEQAPVSGYNSESCPVFGFSEEIMSQMRQHTTGIVPVITGVAAHAVLTDFVSFNP